MPERVAATLSMSGSVCECVHRTEGLVVGKTWACECNLHCDIHVYHVTVMPKP